MALRFEAGWDHADIGTVGIRVTETVGTTATEVLVTTSSFCHTDLSSVMGSGQYTAFGTKLAGLLQGASRHNQQYSVTWTGSVPEYVVASDGSFAINAATAGTTFDTAVGNRMFDILGFSGAQADDTAHTSDERPFYVVVADLGAKSLVEDDYEPDGVVDGAHSSDGSHYAVAPQAAPTFHDFTVQFEAKAAVFKRSATTAIPWTYQHMWEHIRGDTPIAVFDSLGSENTVHHLRPESARFRAERAAQDWDRWHMRLQTYVDGRL